MANSTKHAPMRAWRSRWAAIGAAVAVTLGAGGMVAVNAAPSAPSSFVSIDPTRVLDTRTDVGLPVPFVSGVAQKLQVTGVVPTQPAGNPSPPPVNQAVVPGWCQRRRAERDGGASGFQRLLVDSAR